MAQLFKSETNSNDKTYETQHSGSEHRIQPAKHGQKPLRDKAEKLLRAVFMRGALPRGRAAEILNMSERSARRTVSALIEEGLLQSQSHRAPLTIGLPIHVLPYYFPDLYDPSVNGNRRRYTISQSRLIRPEKAISYL